MLHTHSMETIESIPYVPLHKKYRRDAVEQQDFCERNEFSIKFMCMVAFALSIILCGAAFSALLQDSRNRD